MSARSTVQWASSDISPCRDQFYVRFIFIWRAASPAVTCKIILSNQVTISQMYFWCSAHHSQFLSHKAPWHLNLQKWNPWNYSSLSNTCTVTPPKLLKPTYGDPIVLVGDLDVVPFPRDGGFGMASGGDALHDGRLPCCHHHITGRLTEVIS